MAAVVGCRLLLVCREETTAWAWLGSRRGLDPADVEGALDSISHARVTFAIGEPGAGLSGWRLTHRQAAAALPIALRRDEPLVRYADVVLLASALQDDLLASSLRDLYLAPLERERDGGKVARETLRAYFAAERNVSSAAAALGVKRHTVTSRLRGIEQQLTPSLDSNAAGLEIALDLEKLGHTESQPDHRRWPSSTER